MNLVALLIAPAIVTISVGEYANVTLRWSIAIGATAIVVVAVIVSKRRPISVNDQVAASA
jgi:K(+)-stimulated pyrophosphate-energized sodium pump